MDNYKHYRYSKEGKLFTMFVGPDMPPHVWDGEKMCRLEPIDPNMTEIKLGTVRVSGGEYSFDGTTVGKDKDLKPVDNDVEALLAVVEDFVNDTLNRKTIPDHKAVWADVNYIHRIKYWLNKNKESKHDGRIG